MKRVLIASVLAVLMAAPVVWSQVPQTMSYQGVLTDGAGTPVADGNYDLTFKLYSVPSGGSEFWSETQTVAVSGGIFDVILGSVTPITGLFNMQYYLGITVGAGSEMVPRTPLTASPYSMSSRAVVGTDNWVPASGNVGIGTTAPVEKLTVISNSGGSRFVNIQRTDDLTGGNDLLQLSIGAGSDPNSQFIECENGGTMFQVNGDGHVFANGAIRLGNTSRTLDGVIRFTGSDFEGFNGGWVSLTSSGGALPSGTAGQTLRHNGSSWVASSLLTNDGTTLDVGTPSLNGDLKLYGNGVATEMANLFSTTTGGWLVMKDEADNITVQLRPSGNGTGGYLSVNRPSGALGFAVNGNWLGTADAGMSIIGSSRSVVFRTDQIGDNSVDLPNNAVSASEMDDEPGAASATMGGANISLDGTLETLLSRSITVPATGYVLVLASLQTSMAHTSGTQTWANIGVSDDAGAFPANQDIAVGVSADATTASYYMQATPHGLFSVLSGTHTFYLLAQEHGGEVVINDIQLTLVYVPTAYGTVSPTVVTGVQVSDDQASERAALSAQEIEAERLESMVFNQARIERELAEMRARLETLKQQLEQERGR